jgi:hypothetical protein
MMETLAFQKMTRKIVATTAYFRDNNSTAVVNQLLDSFRDVSMALWRSATRSGRDRDAAMRAMKLLLPYGMILKGLWDGVRWGTMSNLTFSCLAYISLLAVACAPSSLGGGGDLLHFDTLAISMQSYVPSCFLSFCLGERGSSSAICVVLMHAFT